MRARLVVLAVVLGVLVIQLSRESGRAVAPASRPLQETLLPAPPAEPTSAPPPPLARRDPFHFVDEGAVATTRPALPALSTPRPFEEPEAPARVRLVGLVRRAGVLRAALVVDGGVVLASAGDTVSGYLVLSLDEDAGVRVRDPQGLEMALTLPEEP
jgi:hypothetical protein